MKRIHFICECGCNAEQSPATKSVQLKKWGKQLCPHCTLQSSRTKHSARMTALYSKQGRNVDVVQVTCQSCGLPREVQRRQAKASTICASCAAIEGYSTNRQSYIEASAKRVGDTNFGLAVSRGIRSTFDEQERSRRASVACAYWKDEYQRKTILERRLTDEYRAAISSGLLRPEVRVKLAANARTHWKLMWQKPEFRAKMALIRSQQLSHISKIHKTVNSLLDLFGIEYINEYPVGPWVFDCFIKSRNILIEVQGDYWHSLPKAISNDQAKSTYINRYFPEFKIIYIYEHELHQKDAVIDRLKSELGMELPQQIDLDLRSVIIKHVVSDEIREFMFRYHYIGPRSHSQHFGFYIGDTLIAAASVSGITRSQTASRLDLHTSDIRELTRFCIHQLYHKKNLASRCLSLLCKWLAAEVEYSRLISFADPAFGHSGTIYKAANWQYDGLTEPSYYYRSDDNFVMHKKTLYNRAINLGIKESEFAIKFGYEKVYCPGKHRFIYKLRR